MHRKFKEKMALDDLLNEMEDTAHNIEGIYATSCHLFDFCTEHSNIEQIKNMSYIIETMKNSLFCLNKELQSIVNSQKYHSSGILDAISENMAGGEYIIEDD